jgi:hypothetical protein
MNQVSRRTRKLSAGKGGEDPDPALPWSQSPTRFPLPRMGSSARGFGVGQSLVHLPACWGLGLLPSSEILTKRSSLGNRLPTKGLLSLTWKVGGGVLE